MSAAVVGVVGVVVDWGSWADDGFEAGLCLLQVILRMTELTVD